MNCAEMSSELLVELYERLQRDRRTAVARNAPSDEVMSVSNAGTPGVGPAPQSVL